MTRLKAISLLVTLGLVCSILVTVVVGPATALQNRFSFEIDGVATGSGSAGSGSIAVAAFFDVKSSSGTGGFSGALLDKAFYQEKDSIFSLNSGTSPLIPLLPCGPGGEVGAAGSVVAGSFLGERVVIAGCVDFPAGEIMIFPNSSSEAYFAGNIFGPSNLVTVTSSSLKVGFVGAGITSGSGTAGNGTLYSAEADALTKDGHLVGGGALVGSISDVNSGAVWQINKATLGPGCTITTSGVTTPTGSFPNQPVSSGYTLTSCPTPVNGPRVADYQFIVGFSDRPIYAGHGTSYCVQYRETDA